MANERTLFERILDPEHKQPRTARERKDMMAKSVIHHLSRLLNSREGCCLTLKDFGMPDIESKGGSRKELQHDLEMSLRNTISRHEPRLRRVLVRMEETEEERLVPKFTITAELIAAESFAKEIAFTTIVDPSGKFEVNE